MDWFRFYHGAYKDPKVRNLRADLHKFWVHVLCVASESKPRGFIESEESLRLTLGLPAAQVRRWVGELCALGLVDRGEGETFSPHNWEARQKRSDDAAKRKSKQREKTCDEAAESEEKPETQEQTENGATMSRDTSEAIVLLELELELEKDKENTPQTPKHDDGPETIPITEAKPKRKPNPKVDRHSDEYVPPAWIDASLWKEYLVVRRHKNAVLSYNSVELIVKELEKFRDKHGCDPNEILKNSVMGPWVGVFLPRHLQDQKNSSPWNASTQKPASKQQVFYADDDAETNRFDPICAGGQS